MRYFLFNLLEPAAQTDMRNLWSVIVYFFYFGAFFSRTGDTDEKSVQAMDTEQPTMTDNDPKQEGK